MATRGYPRVIADDGWTAVMGRAGGRDPIDGAGRWAGLIAPGLFLLLVIVLGWLEPGYNGLEEPMSKLGGVPGTRGSMFNRGVQIVGLLVGLFAIALARRLRWSRAASVGAVLLVAGGVGMIGSGVFHCAPDCVNVLEAPDRAGRLHGVFAFLSGLGTGLAPIAYWLSMRRTAHWRAFAGVTLITAVAANAVGLVFWAGMFLGWGMPAVDGLVQRLGIFITLAWVFATALRMGRVPG